MIIFYGILDNLTNNYVFIPIWMNFNSIYFYYSARNILPTCLFAFIWAGNAAASVVNISMKPVNIPTIVQGTIIFIGGASPPLLKILLIKTKKLVIIEYPANPPNKIPINSIIIPSVASSRKI